MRSEVATALALLFAGSALHARRLPIQVFTSAQGLPRNTVNCMVPGATGLMWFCTSEGLARFDGYRFRVFGPEHGLPSRNIEAFIPARHGGFWVVTDKGICRIGAAAKITEPCPVLAVDHPAGGFSSVFESETGSTWATTATAIFRLSPDGKALHKVPLRLPPNQLILTLADGNAGAILVGTSIELFEWKTAAGGAGSLTNLAAEWGAIGPRAILRLSPTEFLVGANSGLFLLRQRGGTSAVTRIPLGNNEPVTGLVRRKDGNVWTGGFAGIARIVINADGGIQAEKQFGEADGLPAITISDFVEDSQGSLWGATEGAGVFRIEESGFVAYSTQDGLGNARIASLFEDGAGRLVVETSWDHGINVHVRNEDRFEEVKIRTPAIRSLGWGWNQFVLPGRNGEWWVPTGEGLLRFPVLARTEDLARTAPVAMYGRKSPLGCQDVFRLFEDSGGDVWISCMDPRQLTRWERKTGQFHRWTAADGYPADAVTMSIRESPGKGLWMATPRAAVRLRNNRFQAFPLLPPPEPAVVRDMMVDHAGRIWFATTRAGVVRCDDPEAAHPTFRAYTVANGLGTNSVNSLTEDRAGFIYAGTAVGVDRIDPAAPMDSRRIRHFTAAEGLPDSEQNTAFRDNRGHLWFGTLHGLAEFDPEKSVHQAPADVYLTRVRVRGEEVPLPWEGARNLRLDLASDRNQVEIEYAGVDFNRAQSLRYQYRLNGADGKWSEPVDQRSVNYASLPAGAFRFEVRALDADGQMSPVAAAMELEIAAPLWRRWWFILALAALVILVTARVYQYRVQNLLAMERLRTSIATDLHDDIGASLSQISILSELAQRNPASGVVADIGVIARDLVQDMSDIVWAVNPRHDRFDALLHRMRRFASDTLADIEPEFETAGIPEDFSVPLHARRPLYLVFKESVNNVARHAGASRVRIRLETDRTTLRLVVEDDGRGFDRGERASEQDGEGVASISRRMRDMGGSAEWERRAEGGTRFTATLPLRAVRG